LEGITLPCLLAVQHPFSSSFSTTCTFIHSMQLQQVRQRQWLQQLHLRRSMHSSSPSSSSSSSRQEAAGSPWCRLLQGMLGWSLG
jgi:hypothetical protein